MEEVNLLKVKFETALKEHEEKQPKIEDIK